MILHQFPKSEVFDSFSISSHLQDNCSYQSLPNPRENWDQSIYKRNQVLYYSYRFRLFDAKIQIILEINKFLIFFYLKKTM